MKRTTIVLLVALVMLSLASIARARGRHVTVRPGPHRTTVVVHRGWPIARPLPAVAVRPIRRPFAVAPAVFLAPVIWRPAVVVLPLRDRLVWEDSEVLDRDADWTEFTLNVEERGQRLFLQVDGRVQLNFAEVVFENGDAQVVDFDERTQGSGLYSLLDFRDGRRVDHVRLVARAKSGEARITLRLDR